MNRQEWNDKYPVRRMMTDGKWDFMREPDCRDMRQCVYKTRREAEQARALAFRVYRNLLAQSAARDIDAPLGASFGGDQ